MKRFLTALMAVLTAVLCLGLTVLSASAPVIREEVAGNYIVESGNGEYDFL